MDYRDEMDYLKLEDCVRGGVYRLACRRLLLGVFDGEAGFVGIRCKANDRFLFTEYHWDYDGPYGTVKPLELLGMLSSDVETRVEAPHLCHGCGREVEFNRDFGVATPPGSPWTHVEDGTPMESDEWPAHDVYRPLFDFLAKMERDNPETDDSENGPPGYYHPNGLEKQK